MKKEIPVTGNEERETTVANLIANELAMAA
jgi:hypothetical protein